MRTCFIYRITTLCAAIWLLSLPLFAQTIFEDNFESGTLKPEWIPRVSSRGLVTVAKTVGTTYVPFEGDYGLAAGFAQDFSSTTEINAVDLRLKLGQYANQKVELLFFLKDVDDSEGTQDGLLFSNNGGQTFSSQWFQFHPGAYRDEWGAFPPFDLAKVSGLTLTDNFVIRFQQQGNRDFNAAGGTDGYLFDNVVVRVAPVQYATLPFKDDFEGATFKSAWRHADPFHDGLTLDPSNLDRLRPDVVVAPLSGFAGVTFDAKSGKQVLAQGQRQDPTSNAHYAAAAADLHLNLRDKTQVELRFWVNDLGAYDHPTETAIFFSDNGGASFKRVYDLPFQSWRDDTWGQLPPIDVDALAAANNLRLTERFIIRFQSLHNRDFNPAGGRSGVLIDDVEVFEPNIQYAKVPFFDDFESGTFGPAWHERDARVNGGTIADDDWRRPDHLVDVLSASSGVTFDARSGTKVLVMGLRQDPASGTQFAVNSIDLHVNLKNTPQTELSFWMRDYADGTNPEDGIYFSEDGGLVFKKVYDLKPASVADVWTPYRINIDQACSTAGLTKSATFVIRLQHRGNKDFLATGGQGGFIFDDVKVCLPPELAIAKEDTRCGLDNGSITVTATGGSGNPFTYAWNNGATTSSIRGLAWGTYTVTVTELGGCSSTVSVDIADSNDPPALIPSITNNTSCKSPNGRINLIAIGFDSPFSYDWGPNLPNTQEITGLAAGTYYATVTNSKGCASYDTIEVTDPDVGFVSIAVIIHTTCGLSNGSLQARIQGGSTAVSWKWSNGAMGITATNLAAGTYTVTMTDTNGCTATASGTVNASVNNTTLDFIVTQSTCGFNNGRIQTVVQGGVAQRYNWNTGSASSQIANLPPGIYTVTMFDANGCSRVKSDSIRRSFPLTVNLGPDLQIQAGQPAVLCAGGPYTSWLWSNNMTTECINVTTQGTYSVTVRDANGCSATDQVVVSVVVSIKDLTNYYKITLSPNPAHETLRIALDPTTPTTNWEPLQWEIIALDGKRCNFGSWPSKQSTTDILVGELSPGGYWLRLCGSQGVWQGRFLRH